MFPDFIKKFRFFPFQAPQYYFQIVNWVRLNKATARLTWHFLTRCFPPRWRNQGSVSLGNVSSASAFASLHWSLVSPKMHEIFKKYTLQSLWQRRCFEKLWKGAIFCVSRYHRFQKTKPAFFFPLVIIWLRQGNKKTVIVQFALNKNIALCCYPLK